MTMKKLIGVGFAVLTLMGARAENVAYLSETGNDGTAALNDEGHPYGTLQAAVEALRETGGTVSVAAGTYALTTSEAPEKYQTSIYTAGASCAVIVNPVQIVGATGNPKDVVFKRDSSVPSARVFFLDHADAKLKYVTVQDGKFVDSTMRNGGNVLIGSNGGTVEDCILKNGNAGNQNNTNIGGGNIALMAGRCSRTVITGGTLAHYRPIGLNVMAAGSSVVENCLITKGKCTNKHEAAADEGAVALKDSAKLINCTVVGNTANRFSGVNILAKTALAINCVICGNTVTYETDARGDLNDASANGVSKNGGNRSCYVNCGTDLDTTKYPQLNDTCFTVKMSDFTDAANGDWTPTVNSVTRDGGGDDYSGSGAVSSTDLAGQVREQGARVDVGCYELAPAFHFDSVSVDAMRFVLNDGRALATFAAEAVDATGDVTYTWDFGDGSDPETTDQTTIQHSYTAAGTYSVKVCATCDIGTVEYAFDEQIVVLAFSVAAFRSAEVSLSNVPVTFWTETESDATVTYTWDFGDGSDAFVTTETSVEHVYAKSGFFAVSVFADGGAAGKLTVSFDSDLAIVEPDIYVNAASSSTMFPFATPQTAAKSPKDIWQYLVDGMTVHVAPGTYQTKDWEIVVDKAVTVLGEGTTPSETVFHNGYANFNNGKRNMTVKNAQALVANVTLMGGWANFSAGGNLLLQSGVVSNCVLSTGGSNSSGGMGGGACVEGGLLTHCVVTNSYLGNRGNGITICQKGGRVSNCLITRNRRAWSNSRNAFALYFADAGVIDNCTIADCWILKNNPNNKLQMGTSSDSPVKVSGTGKAYNLTIADIRWDIVPAEGEDRDELLSKLERPRRWTGTAASFVSCATDDAIPINDTCFVGTLEKGSLFADYENKDLTPGAVTKNRGAASGDFAFPSVDLAGNPRVVGKAIDIGCYERQPAKGFGIIVR